MSRPNPQAQEAANAWWAAPSGIGIVVSGGAPTLHLAAGALCAFHERELSFDVVATSGAGALPGLLYAAAKDGKPRAALRRVVDLNIHDAIYHLIPNNYKVFFKYGPFSQPFWELGKLIPHFNVPEDQRYKNPFQRLLNDVIDLAVAAVTPTTLTYRAKSVLTRVRVVDDLIDFAALRDYPKEFLLNAFNIETYALQAFDKATLTADHFYAALAMPWLYPPTPVGATPYTEGASHDPSGLEALHEVAPSPAKKLDTLIVLDTIGPDLWTDPESIYEALQLTIMDPIVTLTENVTALYSLQEVVFNAIPGFALPKVYRLPFQIPNWEHGRTLEWTYSNAVTLWDIGYDAAQKFHAALYPSSGQSNTPGQRSLQGNQAAPLEDYRYFGTLKPESRAADFLKLFGDPFPDASKARGVPRPGTNLGGAS